jgi:hypothetical protein
MKIGLNQVLIPPDFGVDGYCGIYQPLKKVIMTLKEDSIFKFKFNLSYIMNSQISKISEIMEDIKQDITNY